MMGNTAISLNVDFPALHLLWYCINMRYRRPSLNDIYVPDPKRIQHDRIVVRSRHFHSVIAEKLRANPEYLSLAKSNLNRWMKLQIDRNGFAAPIFVEWKSILSEKSIEDIIQLLLSETENADRLRSSSPFAGILSEEERLAIIETHGPIAA
jgi:hypothetical protein